MNKIKMIATKNFVGKYGDLKKGEVFEIDDNELPLYKFFGNSEVFSDKKTDVSDIDFNKSEDINKTETKVIKTVNKRKNKNDE